MNPDLHAALCAQLREWEEALLQPEVRRSPERVTALLTEDFCEFGSSGRVFTRPALLRLLAVEETVTLHLSDFTCTLLAPDVALLTYRSQRQDPGTAIISSLRSSVWVRQSDGVWRLRFHQGTRL